MFPLVVSQEFEVEADNEYVIRGNSAIMKCEIPSFVADFVAVTMWSDSAGNEYPPNSNDYGTLRMHLFRKVNSGGASVIGFHLLYTACSLSSSFCLLPNTDGLLAVS